MFTYKTGGGGWGKIKIGSPQLRSWNCLRVLDQCSPRSLLATEDLVLDDVVLLAIRKQAFRESEKPIRGCQ